MTKVLSILLTIFISQQVIAKKYFDTEIPETINYMGKDLILNGVGMRKSMGFIKVYTGALYTTHKMTTKAEVFKDEGPKVLVLSFVYSVGKKRMEKQCYSAIQEVTTDEEYKSIRKSFKEYSSAMQETTKGKTQMVVKFSKQGVELSFNKLDKETKKWVLSKKVTDLKDPLYSKYLIKVWFSDAVNSGLSEGLLGKK